MARQQTATLNYVGSNPIRRFSHHNNTHEVDMSTKIYYGARVKIENWLPVIQTISSRVWDAHIGAMKKYHFNSEQIHNIIGDLRMRSDFECGLNLGFHEGYCYIIPWLTRGGLDEFLKCCEEINELEEYAYWNNTDAPDDLTEDELKEWYARGPIWEDALKAMDKYRFVHEICVYSVPHQQVRFLVDLGIMKL